MNTIGASFSGGGFRAAAFTFGCLDLLQRVKLGDRTLLQNIAFSSSTSGGSIAMAYHAVRSYRGDAFPAILEGARKHMTGETLLAEAIAVLNDPAPWKEYPAKTRNLINAFAIVYDRTLYQGARSGLFTDRSKQPPIPRYCFNTTELNNCMSFRFDLSGEARYTEQVGNWHQHFAPMSDAVNGMRIADIAAASSCFPGGFEPLLFPRDLQDAPHNDPLETAIVDDTGQPLPEARRVFGLSDGGVVDNQGLYALKVEADRRHERNTWAKNAGRRPEGDEGGRDDGGATKPIGQRAEWRDQRGGDTSILGWVVMVLKSAREVGVNVPPEANAAATRWLDKVASGTNRGLASYQPANLARSKRDGEVSPTMTAEAWVCRQFLGFGGPGPASDEAAEYLLATHDTGSPMNLYDWYYGTLAMFQHGGEPWSRWNALVRDRLVQRQHARGVLRTPQRCQQRSQRESQPHLRGPGFGLGGLLIQKFIGLF